MEHLETTLTLVIRLHGDGELNTVERRHFHDTAAATAALVDQLEAVLVGEGVPAT